MVLLDSLPADQRAVLELVLRQGRGYDEIERLLAIDRTAVRARALAAVDAIGPPTALGAPKRALIADYVLGQLPPRVAADVAAGLERSPDERTWAQALVSELAPVASRPMPEIPGGSSHDERPPRPSSRLGGAILLGAGAVVAIAVAVFLLTQGGSNHHKTTPRATTSVQASVPTTTASTTTTQPKILGQVNLLPPNGKGRAKGIAEVIAESGKLAVLIVASGLTPNTKRDVYAVWLYSSSSREVRVGFVTPGVGSNGRVERLGLLPSNAASYTRLMVTLEPQPPPSTPGTVVLTGALKIP